MPPRVLFAYHAALANTQMRSDDPLAVPPRSMEFASPANRILPVLFL